MVDAEDTYKLLHEHATNSQNKSNKIERSKSMPSLTRRKRERISTKCSSPVPNQHIHLRPPYRPLWSSRQDVPAHHNHNHHQEKTYLGTRRLLESRSGLPEGSSDDGLRTHGGDVVGGKWKQTNSLVCPSKRSLSLNFRRIEDRRRIPRSLFLRRIIIFVRQSPLPA